MKKDKKDRKAKSVFDPDAEDLGLDPNAKPVNPEDDTTVRKFDYRGKQYSYVNMSMEDFELHEEKMKSGTKKGPVQDKIFGNSFNTGNIEQQKLPDIKVRDDFASAFLGECYNSEEYHVKKELTEMVYEIFKKSQWNGLPLGKKFSKELMPYIFNDLYSGLQDQGYTSIDMFIAIAEFMDVSYEKVYESTGVKVKEQIIKEIEAKYKLLSKKRINRLF